MPRSNDKKSNFQKAKDKLTVAKSTLLSPLRYPGSKRRLAPYIGETLQLNSVKPKLFIEPFAGGASVSLQLLQDGLVERIALGEKDPLVASFWKTAFYDSEWLIDQVQKIKVTLSKWDYFKNTAFRSNRERALACLFLNRTSFSGILASSAGPIGGRGQKSDYKIDCRFPVETLSERIRQIAKLKERVQFIVEGNYKDTFKKVKSLRVKEKDVFYYLDPPFYDKADCLYRFFFRQADHDDLHNFLISINSYWILSYDSVEPIISMYSHNGRGPKHVDQLYSAAGNGSRTAARELIVSNLPNLPRKTKLWKSKERWSLAVAKKNRIGVQNAK